MPSPRNSGSTYTPNRNALCRVRRRLSNRNPATPMSRASMKAPNTRSSASACSETRAAHHSRGNGSRSGTVEVKASGSPA